jgi:hypothetical protein
MPVSTGLFWKVFFGIILGLLWPLFIPKVGQCQQVSFGTILGLFWHCNRSLLALVHTPGMPVPTGLLCSLVDSFLIFVGLFFKSHLTLCAYLSAEYACVCVCVCVRACVRACARARCWRWSGATC